jgi:glycerophosphoryl diester phosphodiesterase
MAEAQAAPAWSLVPDRDGPAIIAHAAGNSVRRANAAIAAHTDFIEVDLWVRHGRFEARHERDIYPIPILYEKWYLRFAPRKPFGLAELIRETGGRTDLFLDLKSGASDAARLVRRSIDHAGVPVRLVASSQHWATLRAAREIIPEVETFYSIDVLAKLDLFFSIIERDVHPRGVSCRERLLTRPVVDRLHSLDLMVVAWTVDDVDRARELAAWGVDGLTTHRVAELRESLGLAP